MQNNILENIAARAPQGVVNAIKTASAKTGVNFAYLLQQADVESSFRPGVKAASSSATGLYQFIESTWLGMVNKYGEKYGLGEMASKIDQNGRVASKADRAQILEMRKNPEVASLMAAEFAAENNQALNSNWGGNVGSTELYLAHFLGPGQASAFLNSRDQNPLQAAADLFPSAARSNRAVFYDQGRARSLEEVYAFFDKKFTVDTGKQYESAVQKPQAPVNVESLLQADATNRMLDTSNTSFTVDTPRNHYNSLVFKTANQTASLNAGAVPSTYYRLIAAPVDVMMLADMGTPSYAKKSVYN